MGLFDALLDRVAERVGRRVQGRAEGQAYRDAKAKGDGYSVECDMAESLTDLMMLGFKMPVTGGTARAEWLDGVSTAYVRGAMRKSVGAGMLTGDSVTIPVWNGRTMDNHIVDAEGYEILSAVGDRITAMVATFDEKRLQNGTVWTLMYLIELVPYEAAGGGEAMMCRYRRFIARNGSLTPVDPATVRDIADWADYADEWAVPNVDRLLVGRWKSFTANPRDWNSAKGVPICFGAGEAIREIHYLLRQMHAEFGLSEKAIIADKRMFVKRVGRVKREDGSFEDVERVDLPEGRDRLFVLPSVRQRSADGAGELIHDWSPEIRYTAYLEAIDKQEQLVEKHVGVSSGVISNVNDHSYANVDNVRKSTVKTQSFIGGARNVSEAMLGDLLYAWDVLANYYGIVPMGAHEVSYDWSDDYINTFADMQGGILAGEAIGATDALDYRMFLFGEPPETARERVEEIAASRRASAASAFSLPPEGGGAL